MSLGLVFTKCKVIIWHPQRANPVVPQTRVALEHRTPCRLESVCSTAQCFQPYSAKTKSVWENNLVCLSTDLMGSDNDFSATWSPDVLSGRMTRIWRASLFLTLREDFWNFWYLLDNNRWITHSIQHIFTFPQKSRQSD